LKNSYHPAIFTVIKAIEIPFFLIKYEILKISNKKKEKEKIKLIIIKNKIKKPLGKRA
jgi:hypothetical protein